MASVTAITVALPAIRSDFGIGFGAQQWIMLSYALALASLYLVAGALDDRLGRRRMFIVGTAGFAQRMSLFRSSATRQAAGSQALLEGEARDGRLYLCGALVG
jgi:MFS family permease